MNTDIPTRARAYLARCPVSVAGQGGHSTAFDAAAKKVGALMRFSPAIGLSGRPVPVRMPQEVRFKLTD